VNTTTKGNAHYAHMAKVFATDTAMEVSSNTIELMGSYGYAKDYGVEKIMRDVKIIQIYIGSNELIRAHCSRLAIHVRQKEEHAKPNTRKEMMIFITLSTLVGHRFH